MTTNVFGKIGAAVTGISVAAFAASMIFGLISGLDVGFVNYLVCIFIAVGYVMFASALIRTGDRPVMAVGLAGLSFAVVYAVLIIIVYYAMLTTVRMNGALSDETLSVINYERMGSLFFNYDLLGYGFMGLSTFFVGFTVIPENKGDRSLRILLWIHGIFFLSCLIMPMFPVFAPDMQGGALIGSLLLLVWCAYFLPVCVLGWKHFNGKRCWLENKPST